MADPDTRDTPAPAPKDETRGEARRNLNRTVAQRQKLLLAGIGGVALIAGSMFIFGGEDEAGADGVGATTIETGALVNRNLSQREFVATYGNRLDAQGRAIKDLQESQLPKASIEQELETLRGENARMLSDGQAAIDAISAENAALRSELETVRANPPVTPVDAGEPRTPGFAPGPLEPPSEPKASLLSFSSEKPGAAKAKATESTPPLLLEASRDYLPPNSYAPATVIVGVDASTGVTSQSDPLPVVLRITGPARSVLQGDKLLTTDLTGCLVNGAARGDLSAEKVYVKLVRMTCAQPGGRFAVSEVKGFIAFAGKSGVRGSPGSSAGSDAASLPTPTASSPVRSAATASARRSRRPTSLRAASARARAKPPTRSANTSSNAQNSTNPSSRCRPASQSRSSFSTASMSGAHPNELLDPAARPQGARRAHIARRRQRSSPPYKRCRGSDRHAGAGRDHARCG